MCLIRQPNTAWNCIFIFYHHWLILWIFKSFSKVVLHKQISTNWFLQPQLAVPYMILERERGPYICWHRGRQGSHGYLWSFHSPITLLAMTNKCPGLQSYGPLASSEGCPSPLTTCLSWWAHLAGAFGMGQMAGSQTEKKYFPWVGTPLKKYLPWYWEDTFLITWTRIAPSVSGCWRSGGCAVGIRLPRQPGSHHVDGCARLCAAPEAGWPDSQNRLVLE